MPRQPRSSLPERELVLASGAFLIALQLGLRAWQLYPSWFYTDDYRLLYDASHARFGWHYLALPFDSQFMPLGRSIAWVVAGSGHVNWGLAASITLGMQLLASGACLWMLTVLFGPRWGILAPLAIYLTSAIGTPALMWWAASLNQLPLQVVLFAAVGLWVTYLRTRRLSWLAATLVILAIGMLAYVKTLLVLGVLAYLLLAYFVSGGLHRRIVQAARSFWPAAVGAGLLGGAFVAYYSQHVPSVFRSGGWSTAASLAHTMIGRAFASGVLGGPWHWDTFNPPTGYADPPPGVGYVCWVVIALVVVLVALLRRRTLRAWALLAGYLVAAYLLVLTSRVEIAGSIIGLEYRYLTDVVPVLVLCLGLATMGVPGAIGSSERRARPLLRLEPSPAMVTAATVLVGGSAVVSSVLYARIWHDDNPGDAYVHTTMDGLDDKGDVDLADQVVPHVVIPGFSMPYNSTKRLLPLLVDNARFPESTSELVVLDDGGSPRLAVIAQGTKSRPGPVPGCGWPVGQAPTTIPLESGLFDFTWWVRIGYLASTDDTMVVRADGTEQEVEVSKGLNNVFVHVEGAFDSITLGGLREPRSRVCVDTVEVGQPVPGGPL